MADSVIFIHSLFRSGSTYLFKVFRRSSAGYWCYQEPLHEMAFFCREDPAGLQEDHGEAKIQLLRHPRLEKPYFTELAEVWSAWKDVVSEGIIYDAYFPDCDVDIGIDYWRSLAKAAKGRPVFQECRTSGRIGAIKNQMGGKHIYLWRNPWDQWWSFKVTPYFDVANQLIVHARRAPKPVNRMLAELQLPCYEQTDLAGSFAFYTEKVLTSEQSYLVFYLLWCLALREGVAHADVVLNIDRLSDSAEYRSHCLERLKDAGIEGVDFSDCQVPQAQYLERDRKFLLALEERVHEWLRQGGWTQEEFAQIQALRQQYQPLCWSASALPQVAADGAEQASRARELAIRFETALAERTHRAAIELNELKARAQMAETRAQQAEAKVQQVEQREAQVHAQLQQALQVSQKAQQLSQQAEAKVQQAEQREAQVHAQLQQALQVSQEAQQLLHQAEARAHDYHNQAHIYQAQIQKAQIKINELGTSNHHWWLQSQQAQIRIDELGGNSHHWWQQACALEAERNALRQSWSWRITFPLRFAAGLALHPVSSVRTGGNWLLHRSIVMSERPLARLMAAVLRRPGFSYRINQFLMRYPALHGQLRSVADQNGVVVNPLHPSPSVGQIGEKLDSSLDDLSPRARRIYIALNVAIRKVG